MRKIILPITLLSVAFYSCSGEEAKEENHEAPEKEVVVEEEVIEEVVEEAPSIAEFIKGTWNKIGQGCDENGNNCEETSGSSNWDFKEDSVTLGRISQPYTISGDTILIAGSPYMITSEMTDTIVLHGMNANRYMKMVKM